MHKSMLSRKYEFKDLGSASTFVGINITRDRPNHCLFIDQSPYVMEILEEFHLLDATPVSIPMNPKESWEILQSNTALKPAEISTYQRAIGKLMYMMHGTRPDISYAVNKLAQYAATPTLRHWQGVLRIMRYLRGYDRVQLCLGTNISPVPPLFPPTNLLGFFDSSLMDCGVTRCCTGGYVFFYDGCVISWSAKKQGIVALSTTEAEFTSGTEAAKELLWICNFLEFRGLLEHNLRLLGDNQSALALAGSTEFKPRTRHIHGRERFIASLVRNKQYLLEYIPNRDMVADIMTKALPRESHHRHAITMGLIFGRMMPNVCYECRAKFDTHNQLYAHIKTMHHYVDIPLNPPEIMTNDMVCTIATTNIIFIFFS